MDCRTSLKLDTNISVSVTKSNQLMEWLCLFRSFPLNGPCGNHQKSPFLILQGSIICIQSSLCKSAERLLLISSVAGLCFQSSFKVLSLKALSRKGNMPFWLLLMHKNSTKSVFSSNFFFTWEIPFFLIAAGELHLWTSAIMCNWRVKLSIWENKHTLARPLNNHLSLQDPISLFNKSYNLFGAKSLLQIPIKSINPFFCLIWEVKVFLKVFCPSRWKWAAEYSSLHIQLQLSLWSSQVNTFHWQSL